MFELFTRPLCGQVVVVGVAVVVVIDAVVGFILRIWKPVPPLDSISAFTSAYASQKPKCYMNTSKGNVRAGPGKQ